MILFKKKFEIIANIDLNYLINITFKNVYLYHGTI